MKPFINKILVGGFKLLKILMFDSTVAKRFMVPTALKSNTLQNRHTIHAYTRS